MKSIMRIVKVVGKLVKGVPGSTVVSEVKNLYTEIKKNKNYSSILDFIMYLVGVGIIYWLISKGLDTDKIKEIIELAKMLN